MYYSDTMLIVDLKGLLDDNIPVFISAVPAKWLNVVVEAVIPPKYISAVYGVYTGIWYDAPLFSHTCPEAISMQDDSLSVPSD